MVAVDERRSRFERLVRAFPIRWRILSISALNSALALMLLLSVWNGAQVYQSAWNELRQVRLTERLLAQIDRETERLQGLIHRYITQPDAKILERITERRGTLVVRLRDRARSDTLVATQVDDLTRITERFLAGFDALREVRAEIGRTYDQKITRPSREMAGLYAIINGLDLPSRAALLPALSTSRESFNAMLLAANSYYLSTSRASAADVGRYATAIQRTVPVMLDLADDDTQRLALAGLRDRAATFASGIDDLAGEFARETALLRDEIDGSTEALSAIVDNLTARVRDFETSAQARFDQTLKDSAWNLVIVAVAFLGLVGFVGVGVSKSISEPLSDLRHGMLAIADGAYDRGPPGILASDEIGDMARAVEVFRQNALAKLLADRLLVEAKERAERALTELRAAQVSLVEAEKLAALGGLVAGVAHEVNNPVGIGLMVATSLTRRSQTLFAELADGPLRRTQLNDFIAAVEEGAEMIASNLQRAGDLVQSFKQVAVDRSDHDRRRFDLAQTCEQIAASLRPGLKAAGITLKVDIPRDIVLDSYPGPLGQLLTNLALNAARHGYRDHNPGTIELSAERGGDGRVTITFRDDGCGMTEDVRRRAFEPFFTTRRGDGGTGLGLHIVFNIATHQLGGRINLVSAVGDGCCFTLSIPTDAPADLDGVWRPQFA